MAVPTSMTTLNFSGKYVQNKALSDSTDEMLGHQGVGWLVRKTVGMATLTVIMTHATAEGVEKLTVRQILTGGMESGSEERVFDGQEREGEAKLWGKTKTVCKRVTLEEVEEDFLKNGWADVVKEHGVLSIHSEGVDRKWTSDAIWGLEEVEDKLRHVRRISFTGPKGEKVTARLVFDYASDA